jgi:phospholipid/cholesterol/gamma-HCH transport system substrate-binding protein
MRRPVLWIGGLVLAVVLVLALRGGSDEKPYRVAAVFDTARGMVPGQLIKIAGTRVGTIESVGLTGDNEARIVFAVDPEFGPFRQDATCKILPEGFISENFVDCEPGTPSRPELTAGREGGDVPVVPLERTEVSVQLQQVLDTFSLPVDQRIRVIMNELGIASAGRGRDFNALLRRANPALGQARKALTVLASRKKEIADATAQTDRVLAALKNRDGDVRTFVAKAADVAETTAARRAQLEDTVRVLPPLLRETRAALGSIRTASAQLAPTARSLQQAAPGLTTLNRLVPPVSTSGSKAFVALAPAARRTARAAEVARPRVQQLDQLAQKAGTPMTQTSDLFTSLRETGGIEYLMNFIYRLAGESSTYDGVSHALTLSLGIQSKCIVNPTTPGCQSQFNTPGRGGIPINSPSTPSAEVSNRTSGANGKGKIPADVLKRQAASGLKGTESLNQLLGVVQELTGGKK